MTRRQADAALLADLNHRVGARVSGWRPEASVRDLRPMTGGTSSLTFLVELDGVPDEESPVVLKVAPPGLEPVRNRDVLRQARLQKALQGRGRSLAPDVLFSDAGTPPDAPPFMAMNLVAGECLEPVLAAATERPAPEQVRTRYLEAARVLASLHSINPLEIGLADEPVVGLDEEIERWTRAFATLPDDLRGDYELAATALHETVPGALPPVVNHGDYRLGNTLCEGDHLNAVIDWEIWSVGDPRVDVAWLTYFTDDAQHPAVEPGTTAGTPSGGDVIRAYQEARGGELPDLDWFRALARYKEAGLTGLLLKRAGKDGKELTGAMQRMRPALPRLVHEAMELVGR